MSSPDEPRAEGTLLEGLRDARMEPRRWRALLDASPPRQPFALGRAWMDLALDASLDSWRRVEAYRVLVERCLDYPVALGAFEDAALAPFGLGRGSAVDMTMAQALPIERNHGEAIWMVPLPIPTSVGSAAVYYAVRRATEDVLRAGVSPWGPPAGPSAGPAQ